MLYFHSPRVPIAKRAGEFGLEGADFGWKHNTMDWQQASHHVNRMTRDIKNSVPIGTHGFSIVALSYLLSREFSCEDFAAVTESVGAIVRRGLADHDFSMEDEEMRELVGVIRSSDFQRSLSCVA